MRWAGLILSAVILATTVWFVAAAPHQTGGQLVRFAEMPAAAASNWL